MAVIINRGKTANDHASRSAYNRKVPRTYQNIPV